MVLSPASSDIEAVLVEADARWEAAGVDPERVVIGPGGAPVTLEYIGETSEGPIYGETITVGKAGKFTRVKSMRLANLNVENVMHEIGHALGIGAASVVSHPISGPECETENRPLMCPVGRGPKITETDLSTACDKGVCVGFSPEID